MEFGRVENLENIKWELPVDDSSTAGFLDSIRTSNTSTQFYLGSPAWGRKEWVGRIYPDRTPASQFLFHYSRNFNCIELNSTHYGISKVDVIKGWTEKVPSEFLFCPKIPQLISHIPGGLRDKRNLNLWVECLNHFDRNLGPSFLQLSPFFSYEFKADLFHFLQAWPDHFELAVEFRHPSWFFKGGVLPALVEYLRGRKIGLVITDVAGRRDVLHCSLTSSFSMLRFIGNDLHPTDFTRAKSWAAKLKWWKELGLDRFFFMVHEPDDIKTPEMADWIIEELNKTCGGGLKPLSKPSPAQKTLDL